LPLFEYECEKCGHRFEKIHKFSDRSVKSCPKCKGKVKRLPSAPAIQFKGTGWYITDYARKNSPDSSEEKPKKPSEEKAAGDKPAKDKEKKAAAPKPAGKKSSDD